MTVIELFKKLLAFKSVTPNDDGAFDFIEGYLDEFEVINVDSHDVKNRFIYKKLGDGPHVCFAGHVDVVPAGDGWDSDPFKPIEKDGVITARGTQDMKSGVAAFMYAVKHAENFNGTLSLLLTSDEEGDAKYGTIEVLRYLEKTNKLPEYVIVAEPTCEDRFGDAIKVGRRGSINGVIEVNGLQGHAAYPEKSNNPIHTFSSVLPKVAGYDLDNGDEFFAPSKLVVTDIRSGMEVTNVTPGKLKMMFNVRNSTKTTKEDIEKFIDDNLNHLDYSLTLAQSAKPFVTDSSSLVVTKLEESIKKVTGIDTKLSTAGGTSDARFIAEFGLEVVEFGVKNDKIHAPNESTTVKEVEDLALVFKNLIEIF